MLEDRIIVQDRGIDAGLAALMQNANKGMDPAALMAIQKEVSELKNIIRKANQMVPPPMKEMLPQDMKNAMDKVGQ